MQLKKILAFGTLLAAGSMAHADAVTPFTVNFQGQGTGMAYFSGTYDGLVFSSNAFTVGDYADTGASFTADGADDVALTYVPSDGGVTLTITLANGNYFSGQFAMDIAGLSGSGTLDLFDGSTEVLSNQGLSAAASSCTAPTLGVACNWQNVVFDFSGNANTVVMNFATSNDIFFFNNLSFGATAASAPPGNNVPEPTGTALTMAALGALALVRRRSK